MPASHKWRRIARAQSASFDPCRVRRVAARDHRSGPTGPAGADPERDAPTRPAGGCRCADWPAEHPPRPRLGPVDGLSRRHVAPGRSGHFRRQPRSGDHLSGACCPHRPDSIGPGCRGANVAFPCSPSLPHQSPLHLLTGIADSPVSHHRWRLAKTVASIHGTRHHGPACPTRVPGYTVDPRTRHHGPACPTRVPGYTVDPRTRHHGPACPTRVPGYTLDPWTRRQQQAPG
jgi:hypothetical protein